jgi:putative transposase
MGNKRKQYPTDLKDKEWEKLRTYLPEKKKLGRNHEHSDREIFDALFYLLRSGCSWRMLPHDFPPWQTVYDVFKKWVKLGIFEKINNALRVDIRILEGRDPEPSAGIIDSQSVKTVDIPGERGYDAGKKNQGSQTAYHSRYSWDAIKSYCSPRRYSGS